MNSNGSNERATVHASIIRGSYDIPCGTGRGGTRPSQVHLRRLIAGTGGLGATRAEGFCRSLIRQWPSTAKRSVLCLALLCCLIGADAVLAFDQPQVYTLKAKDHVVIFGDSTTAEGIRPTGYVELLKQAIGEQIPDQGVKVSAICRNTRATSSLMGPTGWVQKDCKSLLNSDQPPTLAIIVLGLNDSKGGPKGVEPYVANLRESVGLLRDMKQTVVLVTPSTWGGLTQTKPYAEACRTLATEMKCLLIDLYAVHADHIVANTKDGKFLPGTKPTWDDVHLSVVGNTLSASAILRAIGLKPVWQKYQLQVSARPVGIAYQAGKASISVQPVQPFYAPGTKITLTMQPEAGHAFNRWYTFEQAEIKETTPALTFTIDRHMWIIGEVKPIEEKQP